MERKKDIRTIKIENKIENTLIDMQSNGEEITVLNLAKKCGINRNTFYIHYKSVSDAFEKIQDGIVSMIIDSLKKYSIEDLANDPEILGHVIVNTLFKEEKLLKFAFGSIDSEKFCIKLTRQIVDYIYNKYLQYEKNNKYALSSIEFLTAGLIYSLFDWYKSKANITAEEVISRLGAISRHGVNSFK